MKRIAPILLLSAVGLVASVAIDAAITRAQLLQMFHAANKATDRNDAIKKWSEIIQEAPGLAKPYLQIAKLYDENSVDPEARDMAILFYRKYIDLEMDPVELSAAEKRLEELENLANVPSFKDMLKSQADSVANVYSKIDAEVSDAGQTLLDQMLGEEALDSVAVEVAEVIEEPESSDVVLVQDTAAVVVEEQPAVVSTPATPAVSNTSSSTTISIAPNLAQAQASAQSLAAATRAATTAAEYSEGLLFPLEKNASRTLQSISQTKDVVATDVIGRWVSQSRLNNNTMQTWVIDIENGVYGLMARVEVISGALSQEFQKSDDRAALQELFANATQVTDFEDINYETMCIFSNIDKLEVPVIVANNCVSIKLNASKKYTTNSSRIMSSMFSLSKIKNVIQSIAKSDDSAAEMEEAVKSFQPFSFSAEVDFTLQMTNTGLSGHATEIVADQNDGKTIVVTKHSFDTKFYRVDKNDQTIGVNVDLQKTDADLAEENALITRLNEEAPHYSDMAYQYGLLLSKGLGDKDGKPNESETYKYMSMAANGGDIDAIKYLISSGYTIAANDTYTKAVRQKNIEIAEQWIKTLASTSPEQAAVAQIPKAKYLLDSQNDFSSALKIYNVALATRDPEAMIAAGDFYLSNGKQDKAIELYTSAVDLGSSDAALSLARAYKESDTGKYIDLVLQAHEKGNTEALHELYAIYLDGIGVDQDYHKANAYYMEYRRAVNSNLKKIIQALEQL
jgi:TPR repeat protein